MSLPNEKSACGVGFVASLENKASFEILGQGLMALANLEHRGGSAADLTTSDGAGIMTDIPYKLFGIEPGSAVASLFLSLDPTLRIRALRIFEETFQSFGLQVSRYREPPVDPSCLSTNCAVTRPAILLAFIEKPVACTTRYSFEKILYSAKQATRSRLRQAGLQQQLFFTSLSSGTVTYKALTSSKLLPEFFLDLKNPDYLTRFALIHRRFSTNTATSWDKAQPFRLVAHNGEINTISGNRAWAYAREKALGLQEDELLTHRGISDSGSVNEMIEALMFRSSIPHAEDILAIMMPQADMNRPFYKFWGRAMEPWDGPALFAYSDGRTIGARLDRSGFRPCRWAKTQSHFYLSSEAGSFEIPESQILAKGSLSGGRSVSVKLSTGDLHFDDASVARENKFASFEPRLRPLPRFSDVTDKFPLNESENLFASLNLFGFSDEDLKKMVLPMVSTGKEPVGSMGDTARLAALSTETRSLFDFFFQNFAQVTNPPLDYLREKMVTDMSVVLGRKPNIFEPKELLPAKRGLECEGPVLTLSQLEFLRSLQSESALSDFGVGTEVFDITFDRNLGFDGFQTKLEALKAQAQTALSHKKNIFILSDRSATLENPPIPSVLVLTALTRSLNDTGMRLRASFVVDTGEVRNTHHLAVLIGFGAAAVCPRLALQIARSTDVSLVGADLATKDSSVRELQLVTTLEQGLLKIMSKMGVSVLQSYQGSGLFTILGLGAGIHKEFFPMHKSWIGGLSLQSLVERILKDTSAEPSSQERGQSTLINNYLYREHPKEIAGEHHSMTLPRSKIIHQLVAKTGLSLESTELYDQYLRANTSAEPVSLRHMLRPKSANQAIPLEQVEENTQIFKRFGSGAMSFGAISAESQRDIIEAMKLIGARSNSGEGGENPYYYSNGTQAHTKQIASGRFGVTAEYLVGGQEIQIKIAQGAKPGEGGQLMACKVGPETARARCSDENVDLISPPPMHDIYSIEDLKQLVFELRQLKPNGRISVKLVSGDNIGTIAVGVAKAGADIIHIAGHDGGTGAATLTSMKHAGLPWEIGLVDCHKALTEQDLRHRVTLRVDGGLATGRDIITAALMGAEEFDFGKILLVAQGCIMARICEKNTCPTGIATHDPKFKKRYKGDTAKIVSMMGFLAEDVRRHLSTMGFATLSEIIGRSDLLETHPDHAELVASRGLDLSAFMSQPLKTSAHERNPFIEDTSVLNTKILEDFRQASVNGPQCTLSYNLNPSDRAVLATLNGELALEKASKRLNALTIIEASNDSSRDATDNVAANQQNGELNVAKDSLPTEDLETILARVSFEFSGSAGQGFAVFTQPGFNIKLNGEANDSVAKSMSGGRVVVVPAKDSSLNPATNSIIGNCALYGATGGILFVNGIAGDRFAIRNSGATAVVEGVGVQACEYMTRGRVVILGAVGNNVGAGMTGGSVFIRKSEITKINSSYVKTFACTAQDLVDLADLLGAYAAETGSQTVRDLLENGELGETFVRVGPEKLLAAEIAVTPPAELAAASSETTV